MKILNLIVILLLILTSSCEKNVNKENESQKIETEVKKEEKQVKKKKVLSPHTSTMAMIGGAHIHIDYSSPGVRNRVIFGGLVGYDNIWQSGAHKATWIETNKDLVIDGKTLPKGKYGFFTIPAKGDWTVVFNKNWDQHGKDEYDEKEDVLRMQITPVISESIQEHLEYKIEKISDTTGDIVLSWEKVSVRIPFEIK